MEFKITSYNIQYGVGQDGKYDLSRIVAALTGQDIICLQEVSKNWRICDRDNQPRLLETELNMYSVYASAFEIDESSRNFDGLITNKRREFGNMVLSRWPIRYSRVHSLPRPYTNVPKEFHPRVDFPRNALETVIDIGGTPLRIICVHLSQLPGEQRMAQISVIKELVQSLPQEATLWDSDPRISAWSEDQKSPPIPESTLILGDFNFEPESTDYKFLLKKENFESRGLIDSWSSSTKNSEISTTCVENDNRRSRLDYMFATEEIGQKVITANVDQSTSASDHFPIRFILEL